MGRDAFKPKHAFSVSISGVIDTGVNSNSVFRFGIYHHKKGLQKIPLYSSLSIEMLLNDSRTT